jgi:imidazolonepropionase-like amidohydrolase
LLALLWRHALALGWLTTPAPFREIDPPMPLPSSPLRSLALCALAAGALACQTVRPILVAPRGSAAAQPTLITSVRIFDGKSNTLSPPSDVLLEGGRIAAIAPAGALSDPRAAAAQKVDGAGRTLLPGLIDCHVHLGGGDGTPPWDSAVPNVDAQAAALVYAGVTTVLAASRDTDFGDLRARIARGALAGPRIIASSRAVTAVGGHPIPFFKALLPWPISSMIVKQRTAQVDGVADAKAAVGRALEDGEADQTRFVKFMYDAIPPGSPRLDKAMLAAAIAEVKARGLRASVHVGSPQDALDAVDAGAALLMHPPHQVELTDAQTALLVKSGVPMVTTARIFTILDQALKKTLRFSPLEKEVMPPGTEASFANAPAHYEVPGFPKSFLDDLGEQDRVAQVNLRKLAAAGARLVAGTDSGLAAAFHGAALHRELQALVALGISPAQALRMATSEAAAVLDEKADYGVVEPGKRADLVLVDGDPLADIAATERITAVWQDGLRVERRPKQ